MTYQELRNKHNWNLPETCPRCGSELTINGKFINCSNSNCGAKTSHKISRYFKVLDVKGCGEVMLASFVNNEASIVEISKRAKNNDTSWFKKIANSINGEKLCSNIRNVMNKEYSLSQFLSLVDYNGFDEKKLKVFDKLSLDEFYNLTAEDILKENGFAAKTTATLLSMISECKEELDNLLPYFKIIGTNVNAIKEEKKEMSDEIYTFCFTGAGCMPRSKLSELAENKGHKVSNSVNSKTSFLVTDDTESGSSKNKKAKELGIKIITSTEFVEMMK